MRSLTDHIFFLAQINSIIGDMEGNSQKIIESIKKAKAGGATVVIFPELALSGYLPGDLLFNQGFMDSIYFFEEKIREETQGIIAIIGSPWKDEKQRYRNAALVMRDKKLVDVVYKVLLPDYDVFNESRYFKPALSPQVISIENTKFGIQICEDAWDHIYLHDIPVTQIQGELGADIIINISASPFYSGKAKERLELVKRHVRTVGVPFIYVNSIGGQDEIVFDGRSFIVNEDQKLVYFLPPFKEDTGFFNAHDFIDEDVKLDDDSIYFGQKYQEIIDAIKLNLKDYLIKLKLKEKALVALSGGIDSAITAWLTTNALGAENVVCCYLPTKFSANQSYSDAKLLADNLGITLLDINIEEIRDLFMEKFHKLTNISNEWEIAEENLQSRIRATIMMYLSNKLGYLLISTGNKSEIATGYCTLYGDTAGGKNLIGDLYKSEVYELSKFINQNNQVIPNSILDRPPTAELKDDQKDTDSLPDYELLDQILTMYIDQEMSQDQIISSFENENISDIVHKVVKLVHKSEFKRKQMVPPVKLSPKAFGAGRIIPIAHRFKS